MAGHETSWEKVSGWYDTITAEEGHFYQREVIIPKSLTLLELDKFPSPHLLDLGCGQGIFSRVLPKNVSYFGVDIAPSLINAAKQYNKHKNHRFAVGDMTKSLPVKKGEVFTHAISLLALQNVEHPQMAIMEASQHVIQNGVLLLVLNHPCFRIPRQSAWGIDPMKKLQYRRIDSYLSPQKIPIASNPGRKESKNTLSFHHPLSNIVDFLYRASFNIETLEEWISPKQSSGKYARMENRARKEFPLFLAIKAVKK